MRRFSKKRQTREYQLRRQEKEMDRDPANHHCWFFPEDDKTSYHHPVPKAQNRALIDDIRNRLPVGDRAHEILTRGTTEQRESLPRWREYLDLVKSLDRSYYNRLMMRFEIRES